MSSFDSNLKRLRSQRNLKQEELAEKMHVSRQTVSGWETGRRQPDLDTLKMLAEVLDVDIHELIYGNKPGEYPKFQKKYVTRTAIYCGIVVLVLLFRLLIWPSFKVLCNTNYWGLALRICYAFLWQFGSFAFGSLIPSVIQLFMPLRMKKQWAKGCLAGGIAALIPVLLPWLGLGIWSRWILYPVGNSLYSYILPTVSGFCITVGATWERT